MSTFEQLTRSRDDMQLYEGDENADDTGVVNVIEPQAQNLTLELSDSLVSCVKLMLAWDRSVPVQSEHNHRKYEELKTAQEQLISVKNSKRMPTMLPLLTLTIGNEKFVRTDQCEILAWFFYRREKIVFQQRDDKYSMRVDIPFSEITSLIVCFDNIGFDTSFKNIGFDTLRIEAKSALKYVPAQRTPGKLPNWSIEDSNKDYHSPEPISVFFELEKGMLDKGLAKLLYADPRLGRVVNVARGTSSDQHMYQGHVHAHTQQTNMFASCPVPSNNNFSHINMLMNSSHTSIQGER